MYPIIFSYKFITIGGYGIMLGLAFYLGFIYGEREFKIGGIDPELAYKLILVVIPSAIIGAKIFHIIENIDEFLSHPFDTIFSGAGLTVYGGFIVTFIVCTYVIKKNNESPLNIFDKVSPILGIGYGIGRLGCHVAGDGCYGIKTSSFLGTAYPNGIVPSTAEVFPTPLFEAFFSFMIAAFLMQYRKREFPEGRMFFLYFILNAIGRFSVEMIRLNPKVILGLTQAQLVAILFLITGTIGIVLVNKKKDEAAS